MKRLVSMNTMRLAVARSAPPREKSVRNGLAAGGKWIRPAGPPRRNEPGFAAEREVPQRRKEPSRKRGTEGSNPGPSTGEAANLGPFRLVGSIGDLGPWECGSPHRQASIQMRAEAHFDGKVGGMISAALRPAQSKPGTFSIARRCAISTRALASALSEASAFPWR